MQLRRYFQPAKAGIEHAGVLRGLQQLSRPHGYERTALLAAGKEHHRFDLRKVWRHRTRFFEDATALDARSDCETLACGSRRAGHICKISVSRRRPRFCMTL